MDGRSAARPIPRAIGRLAVSALAVLLAIVTVTPRRGPVIAPDEMGYLAGARAIAAAGNPLDMAGLPLYPVGWPVVVAVPSRLFAGDPASTYTATVVLQIVLLAATAVMAMLLARSALGVDERVAGVAAALGAATPSAIVTTRFVWSETFVTWWVTMTAAVVFALYRAAFTNRTGRRDLVTASAAGLSVGWMPFAHGRLLPGAVCVATVTIAVLVKQRRPRLLMSFAAFGIVTVVLGRSITSFVRIEVWDDQATSNVEAARRGLSSPSDVWQTIELAGGQVWTMLVGSFGFGAVAVWAALRAWRPQRSDDGRSFWRSSIGTPRRSFALAALTVLAATTVTSAAFFTGSVFRLGTNRQDHLLYGRYLDAFQPLLLTIGLAVVLDAARRRSSRIVWLAGAIAAVSLVAATLFVELVGDDELTNALPFNSFTSLNLARFGPQIGRAALESLVALGLAIVALALVERFVAGRASQRRMTVALAACTLPLLGANLVRWHDAVEATDGVDYRDARAVAEHLERNAVGHVRFDRSIWLGDRLVVQYWMPHLVAERVSLPTEIACDGETAVVTHATTADAEMVSGRLAVVRCDEPGDPVVVEPADTP